MTISNTIRKAGPFTGNGDAVAFPFTFKVFTQADVLVVLEVTATGVETAQTLGSSYTVALNADQNANPGGTITMLTAPPVGATLTATSQVGNLQSMDLTNAGGFYPKVINDALDRATIQIQQLAEKAARSLRMPLSDTSAGTELPGAARRANSLLGFDSSGNPISVAPVAGTATALSVALAASTGAGLVGYLPPDGKPGATTIAARLGLLDGASPTTTGTDAQAAAAVNALRDTSAVSGGTLGFVNFSIYSRNITGAAQTSYEWGITSVMDNYALSGQNVAIYGQGNKRAAGPTWGGVMEAHDRTGTANPIAGLTGLEVDVFGDGADNNNTRIGIDLVAGAGVSMAPVISYGVRIGPVGELATNATFKEGIRLNGDMVRGLNFRNTFQVGIDLSSATISGNAIRLARGQSIAMEGTGGVTLALDATNNVIRMNVAGTEKVGLDSAGPGIRLNAQQIIGARIAGWSASNGVRGVFNGSTATLAQTSAALAQLLTDLATHGLIGA